MPFVAVVGIAVGLAMDAFAVAIGVSIGLRGVTPRQTFRLAFHFGLFQAVMPILGWAVGQYAAQPLMRFGHWIAFLLLAVIGVRAIWDALRNRKDPDRQLRDPTRGFSLVYLSLATSMDAFIVGVSFSMVAVQVWYPAVAIGIITGALTVLGMVFGGWLGRRLGLVMEILGGIILILVGVKALWDGLLS